MGKDYLIEFLNNITGLLTWCLPFEDARQVLSRDRDLQFLATCGETGVAQRSDY